VANLGDRFAEWPRTSHPGYDKQQQRLDDREFLTNDPQSTPNVSVNTESGTSRATDALTLLVEARMTSIAAGRRMILKLSVFRTY
jgi:hypothetical protein